MKIDSHQHFWKYNVREYGWISDDLRILKKNHLPENLLPLLTQNSIDGTVVVQARQSLEETRWSLRLAAENRWIKGVVGWMDLCDENLNDQLNEFSNHPKMVGVRHVIQDEPDDRFILRDDFLRGIERLAKYDLSFDILIFCRHLSVVNEFVSYFPEHRFVLDHIAKPNIKDSIIHPWDDDIRHLASFPNVFCKVSGMVTEADWRHWKVDDFTPYLNTVFEAFGTHRIMFGSDWPVCTVAATYAQVVDIFNKYISQQNFSQEDKEDMLGANAERFYKIYNE